MKKAYGWMTGLVLVSVVMVGLFLTVAPDTLPIHYNAAGEIDGWGSKYTYLLFPFFSAFMGIFLGLVARYEHRQGRPENAAVVTGMAVWVLVLFDALWAFFLIRGLKGTDAVPGEELWVKVLFLLLMASMIPLGNAMPKASRNSLYGLRTKWSMADDVCWQKSQRIGGWSSVGTGIVGVVLAALLPARWVSYACVGCLLLMAVGDTAATYVIWKRRQSP